MSQARGMTTNFDISEGQTPATAIFEPHHHSRFLSIGSISYCSTGSIDSQKKEANPTIFAARVGTSVRPACRPESTTTSGGVKLATDHTGLGHRPQDHINRATHAQNKKTSGNPRASEPWIYPFKPDLDKPISSSPNMMFCICGGVNAPVASRYIRCVMCSRIQHTDCTIPSNKKYAADSEDYKCERCDPDAHIDHLSRESEKRRDEALALIDSCCGALLWEAHGRGLRPHTNYKVLGEVAAPELKMPPEHVEFTRKDSVVCITSIYSQTPL